MISPSNLLFPLAAAFALSVLPLAAAEHAVDFQTQIRPILIESCSACHGGVKQAGDLSFVYKNQVLPPDGWVIEPGDPEASLLIERVKSDDPDMKMPPPGEHTEPLSDEQIRLLEEWIQQGAPWDEHWSRAPLADPLATDSPASTDWARQPLDRLIEARLQIANLSPSTDATPAEWLRRVSFDLTGLPPSVNEFASFEQRLENTSKRQQVDEIYAREVDRLLASQRFGERWASVWMDLARYADSKGYEKDPHRDMWPYRDWLIRAFNEDMPYDEFTVKQLAGDLLEDPEPSDLIATAFHRNTQTNTEGGTDDEEFRVAAVIDRVNTTWTIWQATTFGCVQCHAHPYDPFRHEEFYAFMALLNNTADVDLDNDHPTLKIPRRESARSEAITKQWHYEQLRHQRNDLGRAVAIQDDWSALTPNDVSSSEGELQIVADRIKRKGGTFPPGVTYTVKTNAATMTALRLDIYPEGDDPTKWPEQGSMVTHVAVSLLREGGEPQPIELADVFVDAVTGDHDPRDLLKETNRGVGGYPKLHRPRWAVVVLKQPLQAQEGDLLQITMKHAASVTGNVATPTRHFRWSFSDRDQWTRLIPSDELSRITEQLEAARKEVDAIQGPRLPVVMSLPGDVSRSTRMFIRGNWIERGETVEPGIPSCFADGSAEIRNRLDLARWLVSDANPLAARVWANRVWGQLFGNGIVETQEDFGASGTPPSHPGLLDHLALRLREQHRWRLKPFLRELVLSSTYRQTNRTSEASRERDPRNRLLSRGPRTRLSAEMIRDQALAVSGLLQDDIGGPSVMPPQPEGIWQTVYSGAKWTTAEGPQRYRRGLYTYWRRTSPYPSFLMFDSPTRDICSARRIPTNTPLQALVTLNDPVYVECAQALAARAAAESSVDKPADAIGWMFRAVTQRRPNEIEQSELQSLYLDLVLERESASTESSSEVNVEAMAIVANTVLNLDRALTK